LKAFGLNASVTSVYYSPGGQLVLLTAVGPKTPLDAIFHSTLTSKTISLKAENGRTYNLSLSDFSRYSHHFVHRIGGTQLSHMTMYAHKLTVDALSERGSIYVPADKKKGEDIVQKWYERYSRWSGIPSLPEWAPRMYRLGLEYGVIRPLRSLVVTLSPYDQRPDPTDRLPEGDRFEIIEVESNEATWKTITRLTAALESGMSVPQDIEYYGAEVTSEVQ
jgi:hypothetical protein